MPGSGKGTCTDYLANHLPVIHFGSIVVDEVKRRELEVNEANEKIVREELRQQHGPAAVSILAQTKVDEMTAENEIVVIDGLYSWEEYKEYEQKYGDKLTVIAVFTPRKARYQRLTNREYRPLTIEQAQRRDVAEIENLNKGGPIARADYTLVNSDTPEHLISELTQLLNQELDIAIGK